MKITKAQLTVLLDALKDSHDSNVAYSNQNEAMVQTIAEQKELLDLFEKEPMVNFISIDGGQSTVGDAMIAFFEDMADPSSADEFEEKVEWLEDRYMQIVLEAREDKGFPDPFEDEDDEGQGDPEPDSDTGFVK